METLAIARRDATPPRACGRRDGRGSFVIESATRSDAADGLYVLTRGSLTVLTGLAPGQTPRRLASLPVGWMLGETAMLDGAGRSGTAVADGEVELHHLSADALQQLSASHPLIVARLYANIALHLSQRLRRSTPVLHAQAGNG